jgi:tRNA-uridine 2-sulfurtransferase
MTRQVRALALISGGLDSLLAARLVGRYSPGREAEAVELAYASPDGSARMVRVRPMPAETVQAGWLL